MIFTVMLPFIMAPTVVIRQNYCGPGWTYFDKSNACYKKIAKVSFLDGQSVCQRMKANLASIHSYEENEFVRAFTNPLSDTWLGGEMMEEFYPTLEILDRSVANFDNWEMGRPQEFSGCLKMTRNGTWKVEDSQQIRGSVCKKISFNKCREGFEYSSEFGCQKVVSEQKANCDPGWIYFKKTESCYKVFEDEKYPNGYCITQGASLASIHSQEENDIIATMASSHRRTQTLIGIRREKDKWLTYDKSHVEYFNWAFEEPSYGSKKETCVKMILEKQYDNHKWVEYDCQSADVNYVCKKNYTGGCDFGWMYFDFTNSCYQVFQNASFNEAEEHCLSKNSHLASIHNIRENEFIADLIEKQGQYYPMTWIGGRSKATDRERWLSGKPFNFTDGSSVTFTNWSLHKRKQRNDCIAMHTSAEVEKERPVGSWMDDSCENNWKSSFACKKKAHR